jgi:membrane protein
MADDARTSDDLAASPWQLGRGQWWAVMKRTVGRFQEANLSDWAAALTYYSVLAIFPALIALVGVLGLVGDANTGRSILAIIGQIGPQSAVETFRGPVDTIVNGNGGASIALVLGLLGALWSASGYIGAFMRASNVIYDVEEGRSFWKRRPLQLVVTLIMVVLLALVVLALVLTGPLARAVGDVVGIAGGAVTAWSIAKWPVLLAVVVGMLAILYYASPNARITGFRWLTPGGLLAVLLWIVASAGFALFAANFGSYNRTYGSLAGVIVFLIWLWITNLAVLLGSTFNAELERGRLLDAGHPRAENSVGLKPRTEP